MTIKSIKSPISKGISQFPILGAMTEIIAAIIKIICKGSTKANKKVIYQGRVFPSGIWFFPFFSNLRLASS